MADETEELVVVNGIDGETGQYLVAPMTVQEAASAASQEQDLHRVDELRAATKRLTQPELGLPWDINPEVISQAGWGIVFHKDENPNVRSALKGLIGHRRKQIGNDGIVHELDYKNNETVAGWLARHKVSAGTVDPEKVPFYLLLIGSPEQIPFEFGHLLDVEYAIGRLHFKTGEEYAQYASSVIEHETGKAPKRSGDVAFFGPRHIGDAATKLSSQFLIQALSENSNMFQRLQNRAPYKPLYFEPRQSTKQNLASLFQAKTEAKPSLLFTASHGLGWKMTDVRQATDQGALLCGDFAGPGLVPMSRDHYFAAVDLPGDANLHGLVCFHFACFGGGTPSHDRFLHKTGKVPTQIARESFFSPLPQKLLSHRNGGALGVLAHVERAWQTSIVSTGAGVQLQPFQNAIGRILSGVPLGYALKDFNERFAMLSTSLAALLQQKGFGIDVSDAELSSQWTARNDAEAYILLGDPGAQLRTDRVI
ncbi:MAG: hypothetical protein WKF37_07360 [Bryobacteraceae bacterium]